MSIYLGTPALLLALFAAAAGRRVRFLLLSELVFLLASAGGDLGVQPLLDRFVPGFRLFRYSEKLIWPASLLVALAAALGADAAFSSPRRRWTLAAVEAGRLRRF